MQVQVTATLLGVRKCYQNLLVCVMPQILQQSQQHDKSKTLGCTVVPIWAEALPQM